MKRVRDMDLFRSLMLEIEEGRDAFDPDDYPSEEWAKRSMHLKLIEDAEFVVFFRSISDEWSVMRITGRGHDFLDSVRDPTIWAKTRDGAAAAGGWTLQLLADLGKGLIRQQIKKHTGVEL